MSDESRRTRTAFLEVPREICSPGTRNDMERVKAEGVWRRVIMNRIEEFREADDKSK